MRGTMVKGRSQETHPIASYNRQNAWWTNYGLVTTNFLMAYWVSAIHGLCTRNILVQIYGILRGMGYRKFYCSPLCDTNGKG